jgi:hypothetical protein
MKSMHKHLLTAGLLAAVGLSALAQPAPGTGGPGGHGQMDPARMQEMRARMEQRMNDRLEFFKFKLKITPAQEGAWSTWTAAMKPTGARPQRPDRAEFERMTTPERIDRIRAMRATRQAEMDKRFDATKVLYAQLNPDQRKVFDEESMKMLSRGRGGREGGMGGHHHRG